MEECDLCRGNQGFALVDFIGSLVDQLVTPIDPIPTNKNKASVDHNRFLEVQKPLYRADRYMNDEKRECSRGACKVCSNNVRTFCFDCKVIFHQAGKNGIIVNRFFFTHTVIYSLRVNYIFSKLSQVACTLAKIMQISF